MGKGKTICKLCKKETSSRQGNPCKECSKIHGSKLTEEMTSTETAKSDDSDLTSPKKEETINA